MDEKYNGCNIVESVVRQVDKPRKAAKDRTPISAFLLRLGIAALAVGLILAVHYLPIAALDGVRSVLKQVFCYDVFGRSGIGSSTFFGFIGQ